MAFRLRHGFIEEFMEEGCEGTRSPGTRSDPGSIHSGLERTSAGKLNLISMDSLRRMGNGGSDHAAELESDFGKLRSTDCDDSDTQSEKEEAAERSAMSLRSDAREAVRQLVQRNLSKAAKAQGTQSLTTMLAAIEEITVHVGTALQSSGNTYAEDVQSTIGVLRARMRDEDGTVAANAAIESLDAIPQMIVQSFEASAIDAKKTLQDKVDTVLRSIAEMRLEDGGVVAQMRSISEDVEGITKRAVDDAITSSNTKASRQVGLAKASLPRWRNTLEDANNRIKASGPVVGTHTVQVATSQAIETMEKVVEAVQQRDSGASSLATNEVVADILLRAKGAKGSEIAGPLNAALNSGSLGHPELCTRPCLYFNAGSCANGITCQFCHLPHRKRLHLDKRKRELFKSMSDFECVSMVLPILLARVEEMSLGAELMKLVSNIGVAAQAGQAAPPTGGGGSKEKASLLTVLKALSFRALLIMLNRSSSHAPAQPLSNAIDAVMQHLHVRSNLLILQPQPGQEPLSPCGQPPLPHMLLREAQGGPAAAGAYEVHARRKQGQVEVRRSRQRAAKPQGGYGQSPCSSSTAEPPN